MPAYHPNQKEQPALIKLLAAVITLHDLCNRTTLFKKRTAPPGHRKENGKNDPRNQKNETSEKQKCLVNIFEVTLQKFSGTSAKILKQKNKIAAKTLLRQITSLFYFSTPKVTTAD